MSETNEKRSQPSCFRITEIELTIADNPLGTVSGIYFSGKSVENEELLGLREGLLNWEPFLLELSSTGITDQRLQAIAGNDNLLSINLRENMETDASVLVLTK